MTTLAQRIIEHAGAAPGAVAVVQHDQVLTYRGLAERAAALAAELRTLGVGPEVRVGVCLRRTPDLPVAVLAVQLAGGAYVPLDPGHPVARLTAMLDDAGVRAVLADAAGRALLAGSGRRLVDPATPRPRVDPPTAGTVPGNAAYVLYTSGSTGRPKGVVVSLANATAFADAVAACRPTGPDTRSAAFASLSFDTSLFDLLLPLTTGASVALLDEHDRTDPSALQRFLAGHRVTRAMLPPAVLPLLDPAGLPELAELFAAGEPCGPEQVARWSAGGRRFHNWYGPTETTVIVTGTELTGEWTRALPIGRPLPGCRAHVLDDRLRPCPPGEPGELCIGGPQLARGYLGLPALTARQFVPDPFSGTPGARLYRTGDVVAWRPDGQLAFLGRSDRQVKIHGQRVETGEVEAVLRAHPRVHHAVVDVVADAPGGPRIDAYLTPAGGCAPEEIRAHCRQLLPPHMVPNRVVCVAALALNVSGKVDLARLRADNPVDTGAGPAGEATVAGVWAEVFGGPVPSEDTGFLAAGGHSLLAMRLVSALRARLGRQVDVADVYLGRTAGGLAARVARSPLLVADPLPSGSPAALSAIQRRLWFVERLNPGIAAHNIALAQRVHGELDLDVLRRALRAVAARQEVLRWRVDVVDGAPQVRVTPVAEVPLPVVDLRDRGQDLAAVLGTEARTPFDLSRDPLWRVTAIRLGPREHVLAITVHHLVFDGWSTAVLFRDLADAYRAPGRDLPPLATTFADQVAWSAARRERLGGTALRWWTDRLADTPTVLDLPRDRPRPPVQTFHGATVTDHLPADLATRVRAVADRAGGTAFAVLLAAFAHLLGRLTGQERLVVGTPLAEREEQAFEPVVGCSVHVLPLRLATAGAEGLAALARAAHDELAAATTHRDLPVESLVASLAGRRDLSRNPLVQVVFNLDTLSDAPLDLPGATAEPVVAGLPGSLYDLTVYVAESRGGFGLRAVYNPDLFDAARIAALLAAYRTLLAGLTQAPDLPCAEAGLGETGLGEAGLGETGLGEAAPREGALDVRDTGEPPDTLARFLRHARAHPDRVAAYGAGGALTWAAAAALVARTTAAVRASRASVVAVLAARDVRLPATLLGVLAAGARWVVLDPGAPPAVLAEQVAATGATAAIRLGAGELDLPEVDLAAGSDTTPVPQPQRGYLAMTSGTTGRPRPVRTPATPLAHFLDWYPAEFGLTAGDRFALLAGLAHDPLLRDAFTPAVLGAVLFVPEQDVLREPAALAAALAAEAVTVLHLTPQLARLLAGAAPQPLAAVRLAVFAGDRLSPADLGPLRLLLPNAVLVNAYGTTETPQVQSFAVIPTGAAGADSLPVGTGAPGTRLVVVTPAGLLAGAGELGELVVSGAHLADGYLGEPAGGRFGGGGPAGQRWFRTGDLGRHRPDGSVELVGRCDDQVKVRGFRVEPGAVEAVLLDHPDVRAACVLAVAEGTEHRLCGFVAPTRAGVRAAGITDHLRARLPSYAVPAELVVVPAIPTTRNGKADRSALRALAGTGPKAGPVDAAAQPTGRTERVIAGVWREVLGVGAPHAADNFFDIGGHSMAVVRVCDRLTTLLGRPVAVLDVFRHPTIRALATSLDGGAGTGAVEHALRRAAGRRARARTAATAPQLTASVDSTRS